MKLVQLHYFVAIVETGSFVAAARELDVAQPALSRQISLMEDKLGSKLLRRGRKGAVPTASGKLFYTHARSILDHLEHAIAEVGTGVDSPSGEVRVALSVGTAALIGPKLVQRMASHYPEVLVSIVDGLSHQTGDTIESGQVNFGIVTGAELLVGATSQAVLTENLYLVSKRRGKKPASKTVTLKDVANCELVMPGRMVHLRRYVEDAAHRNGLKLNVRYEQQSLLTILSLVRAGVGSVVIGWPAIHSLWEMGEVDAHQIVSPKLSRVISLAVPSHRPLSPAAKVTYDTLHHLLIEEVNTGNWKGQVLAKTSA